MQAYRVEKIVSRKFAVDVPASKSILNRALVLAAFSGQKIELAAGAYAQDTRDLIACLARLGVQIGKTADGLSVLGKDILREADLHVGSAGTAARFLTTMLAFRGGEYTLSASPQMTARPMEILSALGRAGAEIEYLGEPEHFPFRLRSDGIGAAQMNVDTDTSTQYASGVLLAASRGKTPFTLRLSGKRTDGSYIRMTLAMLEAFGSRYERRGDEIDVFPASFVPKKYTVEPDVSAACYFYALALLCRARVTVHGVHRDSLQGDMLFLRLLEQKGVVFTEEEDGLTADGSAVSSFGGFDVDMHDFSDQALTLAAIAPFAASPTTIRGIAHIRKQECDRIEAIRINLTALGVPCTAEDGSVTMTPSPIRGETIETFGDHRVAMAFSLIGAKTGNILIDDPACCKKTFENFFDVLGSIDT